MSLQLQAVVSLNKSAFDSGLTAMGQLVSNAAGAMAYAFGGVTAELYTMTRAFGPIGAAVVLLKEVTEIGQDFQFTMANVATVTSLTASEMQKVEDATRDFAETTAFTATEAGDALYALASAGFSTAEQLTNLLAPSLKLAGATQAETKLATESLTVTLNAFRLGAEDAMRVADLFAGAIASSPANMERLAEAMAQANPVAAAFNMSLEDTVESIAAFHQVGLMGSEAGTAFRQAMTQLAREVNDANSVLSPALQGWDPAIEGLTGAIARLEAAGITGAQAMEELGIRGGKAVAAQLALGSEAIEALGNKVLATGDVTKMYSTQMDTVHNQWKIFISIMQENGLKIWDAISDSVMNVVTSLQEAAKWIQGFIEAAVSGNGIDYLVNSLKNLWAIISDNVGPAIANLRQFISDGIESLPDIIGPIVTRVVEILTEIFQTGVNIADAVIPIVQSFWNTIYTKIREFVRSVDWQQVGLDLGTYLVAGFNAAVTAVGNFLESEGTNNLAEQIGKLIGSVLRAIGQGISGILGMIAAEHDSIYAALDAFVRGASAVLINALNGLFAGLFDTDNYMDLISAGIYKWMLQAKQSILQYAVYVLDGVDLLVNSVLQGWASGLAKVFELLKMDDIAERIKEDVKGVKISITENFTTPMKTEMEKTQDAINGANETLAQLAEDSKEDTKTFSVDWVQALAAFRTSLDSSSKDADKAFGEIRDSAGNLLVSLGDVNAKYKDVETSATSAAQATEGIGGSGVVTLEGGVVAQLPEKFGTGMDRVVQILETIAGMKGVLWA